jgi:hypothetical protein
MSSQNVPAENSAAQARTAFQASSLETPPGILRQSHAQHLSLPLERDSRSPPCPVAQPVSSLARGDVLRGENAADWIP